jgi:hypothetical protein
VLPMVATTAGTGMLNQRAMGARRIARAIVAA